MGPAIIITGISTHAKLSEKDLFHGGVESQRTKLVTLLRLNCWPVFGAIYQ
jgi:hypothetical protein